MKEQLIERFLRYVHQCTTSCPSSNTTPSSPNQRSFMERLSHELEALGLQEVELDEWGCLMATIPAQGAEKYHSVIGFIAHVDTSPDVSGENIHPQRVECFDGQPILLLGSGEYLSEQEFPELHEFRGHTLITTDGTTLLGADDKAGVAAMVTLADFLLQNPQIAHPKIRLGFTPDEEIGRGADHFSVERFGAHYAYTIDGGGMGIIECANFNAASAHIEITGRNTHPGYAKGVMVNAMELACRFANSLPQGQKPETTSHSEGFFHLTALCGTVGSATMEYLIRDFQSSRFCERKREMEQLAEQLNQTYGPGTVQLTIHDQYYNMADRIPPELLEHSLRAMRAVGLTPRIEAIRGGTDGARLSYMGLPTPNLFNGGMNFHSTKEYCSIDALQKALETMVELCRNTQKLF
ncbi:MAG: peptidase T [Mucinivorans sp.]